MITWDQELPDELVKPALVRFKEPPELSKIKVPRSLKYPGQVNTGGMSMSQAI